MLNVVKNVQFRDTLFMAGSWIQLSHMPSPRIGLKNSYSKATLLHSVSENLQMERPGNKIPHSVSEQVQMERPGNKIPHSVS